MKRCVKCKKIKPVTEFYKNTQRKAEFRSYCKECIAKEKKKYYKKNRRKLVKDSEVYYYSHKKEISERISKRHYENPERRNKVGREKYKENWETIRNTKRKRRINVIDKYGGKCVCCGESEKAFLAFDHTNNDGASHRKKTSDNIVDWIIKNNYPNTIQLLCYNCNMAKAFYKICPHKL